MGGPKASFSLPGIAIDKWLPLFRLIIYSIEFLGVGNAMERLQRSLLKTGLLTLLVLSSWMVPAWAAESGGENSGGQNATQAAVQIVVAIVVIWLAEPLLHGKKRRR